MQAYLARLQAEGIPCYVAAKGDATAGAIMVKLATLDGQATLFQRIMTMEGTRPWDIAAQGRETEVDEAITRARSFDPDLWVIEVESSAGRHMLDEPGLT